MSGGPFLNDNNSAWKDASHAGMPLGYLVPSSGRTGPELRVARDTHELLATGPAARIGTLLPNHTTTTTLAPHGAPLEVRVPFLLAQWLLLGLLIISDAVGHSHVYMYMVGAERLGAALDAVMALFEGNDTVTPSVLRCRLLRLARQLRAEQPVPFTVTHSCLLTVGGDADNLDCAALAVALAVPPLFPSWFTEVTFAMLSSPDGTLVILSELEIVLHPRMFPAQRSNAGGIDTFAVMLDSSLTDKERTIVNALTDPARRSSTPCSSPRCCPLRLRCSTTPAGPPLPASPSPVRSPVLLPAPARSPWAFTRSSP